jgi:hypothetical protein
MSKTTTTILADGAITTADRLVIELVRAIETPDAILLCWPAAPTVTNPRKFGATANAVVAIMAEARAKLATIKAAEM